MVEYSLFGDRANKRVFGSELVNLVTSGKNFIKTGMTIEDLGSRNIKINDGEYYFNGVRVDFSTDTIQLTSAVPGFRLTALLVDSSGVYSVSNGPVSNLKIGVKCPNVNPDTHLCVGLVLLDGASVDTVFNTSIVNDYFSNVYLDDSVDDVVDKNAEDIFELQTVFKSVSSFIPVSNPWVFSDWFTDTTGKLNSVNTAACTAVFDTNKYKLTFGSSTFVRDIHASLTTETASMIVNEINVIPSAYINDIRFIAIAECLSGSGYMAEGSGSIRLTYDDDTTYSSQNVNVSAYGDFRTEQFNHYNNIILDYSKPVKKIELGGYAHGSAYGTWVVNLGAYLEFTPINNVINYITLTGLSDNVTHTKLISNINTTDAIPCPSGDGYNANIGFIGAYMDMSYFKYDLYDSSGNVQSDLSLNTKNEIIGLVGKPTKMVIKIISPTYTHFLSDTHLITNYDNIPLIKDITGYPYINDFCLIGYEEGV